MSGGGRGGHPPLGPTKRQNLDTRKERPSRAKQGTGERPALPLAAGLKADGRVVDSWLMIELTRFNGQPMVVNCTHITTVEATPDTVVTLTTGEKLLVRDSVRDVVDRTARYLRQLGRGPTLVGAHGGLSLRQQEV